jgi:hypothetical protein
MSPKKLSRGEAKGIDQSAFIRQVCTATFLACRTRSMLRITYLIDLVCDRFPCCSLGISLTRRIPPQPSPPARFVSVNQCYQSGLQVKRVRGAPGDMFAIQGSDFETFTLGDPVFTDRAPIELPPSAQVSAHDRLRVGMCADRAFA